MKFDYLIVGQGIAGSTLAYFLKRHGCSVFIIDKYNTNSSSQVAAGLVNPVTGRRIVKSWMADEVLPFAFNFYEEFRKDSGLEIFYPVDAVEVAGNVHEYNEWTRRMNEQGLNRYFSDDSPNDLYRTKIRDFVKLIRITSCGWLDIPLYVSAIRNILTGENNLRDEIFNYSELIISENNVNYHDISADNIIFCEGYKCQSNPIWNLLPMLPAKGEIVVIRCDELPQEFILLSGMFFIPLGENRFRCGSTYEWKFENELPTTSARSKLSEMISNVLKVNFEIIEHTAGVRPTVQDRRPILGMHPEYKNVGIFNGLGTKGASLAPYFANEFFQYLVNGKELMKEVDVKRFFK